MKCSKIKFLIIHQVFFPYRWFHHPDEIQIKVYICYLSYNLQPEPVSLYCRRKIHRTYPAVLWTILPSARELHTRVSQGLSAKQQPAQELLYGRCLTPMHSAPECTEWWVHTVCKGNRGKVTNQKKSIYSVPEIKSQCCFFSKQLKKVVLCLFICGFFKCDFKRNSTYSHWKYNLKFGFHGFWCLWLFT